MSDTNGEGENSYQQEHILNVITIKPTLEDQETVSPTTPQENVNDDLVRAKMKHIDLGNVCKDNKQQDEVQSGMLVWDNEEDIICDYVNMVRFDPSIMTDEPKSRSELAGDRHRRTDRAIFPKLGLRPSQTRTITPSGRRSTNSSLLVEPAKGRSAFHHRFTIEALSQMSKHSTACEDSDDKDVAKALEKTDKFLKEGTRGTSVKFQRRGRSLFRSNAHKRSRARSPGDRDGPDRKFDGVRRESLSPQSGRRKRHWVRKVMTRAEREKKVSEKKREAESG